MFINLILLLLLLTSSFNTSSAYAAEDFSYYSFTGISYPPFIGLNEEGESYGYFVEVAKEMAKRLNLENKKIKVLPPKRSSDDIRENESAILLSSRAYFPKEELRELIFIEVFPIKVSLVGKKKNILDMPNINAVKGKTFVILSGENSHKNFVAEHFARYFEVNSVAQMIGMIKRDRVDFGFCIPIACRESIKKAGFPKDYFDFERFHILDTKGDIVLKKTQKNLVLKAKIEKILRDMKKEKLESLRVLQE